jgi:ABC-type nitrate/sulfonate/bicarbonate transport system substrate-binding protein
MLSSRRVWAILCLLLSGATSHARADAPVNIRVSWIVVPGELTPIYFAHPGIARHAGSSYTLEPVHFAGGPLSIAALAKGEIDLGGLGYATIASAIEGAGIDDLTVIGDVSLDGMPGWFSVEYMVRKDSPIRTLDDLKGKTLGINTVGSMIDVAQRVMLRDHGIDDRGDLTIIEVASPNMKAALASHRVDMIGALPAVAGDPELQELARPLFRQVDAVGKTQISALVARGSFIAAHRAALVDFLEDTIRITRWYIDPANHTEAVKIAADFNKLPTEREEYAFTRRDQYRSPDVMPDPATLQRNLDTLWRLGFEKDRLDIGPHIDLSLVREAGARIR